MSRVHASILNSLTYDNIYRLWYLPPSLRIGISHGRSAFCRHRLSHTCPLTPPSTHTQTRTPCQSLCIHTLTEMNNKYSHDTYLHQECFRHIHISYKQTISCLYVCVCMCVCVRVSHSLYLSLSLPLPLSIHTYIRRLTNSQGKQGSRK